MKLSMHILNIGAHFEERKFLKTQYLFDHCCSLPLITNCFQSCISSRIVWCCNKRIEGNAL